MNARILLVVALSILYTVFGSYAETKGFILEPAYWSLYGYFFGAIQVAVILTRLNNP